MRTNCTRLFLAGWALLDLIPAGTAAVAESPADEAPFTTVGKLILAALGLSSGKPQRWRRIKGANYD